MATKIEWVRNSDGTAGESWNPIRARRKSDDKAGWFCTKVSQGCTHCYSERMNNRLGTGLPYNAASLDEIEIFLDEKVLERPLHWRKPRTVFVMSMGDLFHESVSEERILRVFDTIAKTPQHIYQILTKRPNRMKWIVKQIEDYQYNRFDNLLPNVWLGTSIENQAAADERIPLLLQTPAAVRFVSAEPLLEEIDLTHLYGHISFGDRVDLTVDALSGKYVPAWAGRKAKPDTLLSKIDVGKLDWVICGTESGPGARPWDWDWIRNLRDQCQVARVPFFLKQVTVDGKKVPLPELDGRTWSEMPGQAQEVEVEG